MIIQAKNNLDINKDIIADYFSFKSNRISAHKVFIVTPFYPSDQFLYSGTFVESQVLCLKKNGIDTKVYLCSPRVPLLLEKFKLKWKRLKKINKNYIRSGVNVDVINFFSFPKNIAMQISIWDIERKLEKLVKRENPDILHAHFAIPTGIAACLVGEKMNKPVVMTIHGSDIHTYPYIYNCLYRNAVKYALMKADIVLAVSKYLKEHAMSIAPEANIIVKRIGIDINLFRNEEREEKKESVIKIIFVGNLIKSKGIYDLLNAFAKLCKMITKYQLNLLYIGDGPEKKALFDRAKALKIDQLVILLGARDHGEISRLINEADIVVLPSYKEGMAQVVIEACACGKPVVASKVGGIPEIVDNYVNGILVSPDSVREIVNALMKLIEDPVLRKSMGIKGRVKCEQEYDIEKNTLDLIGVYHRILK